MNTRTRSSHDTSPTYTGLSRNTERGIAIGLSVMSALAIAGLFNSSNSEGDAKKADRVIEKAVSEKDQKSLAALGLKELEGSAVINARTHVRTDPIKVESAGETNNVPQYTDATKKNDTVVALKDPLVYTSPNGDETWYGAKDPDTGEFYWVSASEVTLSKGVKVGEPDVNAESAIYISESRESGS